MSRKKKARNRKDEQIEFLETQLEANGRAIAEGPKKRKWTVHDLKVVKPLKPAQDDMFHAFFQGKHICACGSAGTGKTFLALYLAFNEMLQPESPYNRVIIVRSAVPTRDLGFLPGDLNEKISSYETPYKDILSELFGRGSTYDAMKERGILSFMPTSYIRGLTWDNAIIIVDEGQNMTFHEINSIMTRLGKNSRIIFTGDHPQTDLRGKGEKSGIDTFVAVIKQMKDFSHVQFTPEDIIRSDFVKRWIKATEHILVA